MEEAILYKHSLAVHSSAELGLLERKITNAFLYHAFQNSEAQEENKITVSELLKLIGMRTRNYTQIYLSIRNIATTLIEWGVLKADSFKGNLTGVTFLEMFNIHNGVIKYRLPRELNNLLFSPNQYAKIRLSSVAAMKSSYGVALYENCASYLGWGDTGWISIKDFRKLMGVANKYLIYRDLKRRVIVAAINDVNKHAEFSIELLEKKEGRNISKIKLVVHAKQKPQQSKPKENETLVEQLKSFGLSASKIKYYFSEHSIDYLNEKIEYINGLKNIKNKTGLLIAAIEEDYQVKKIQPNPIVNLQEEGDKFRALKENILSNWIETLSSQQWDDLSRYLIEYANAINPIIHQEFKERLPNKAFLNYSNTKREFYYLAEQLIQANHLSHLKPPKLPSWRDFVRQSV